MRQRNGFTIVELLIVIVVIGTLAAITIVAYNGIQARTENQKTISAVSSWVKILRQYATQSSTGKFPVEASYPCLGDPSEISRCANMQDSTGVCNGAGGATPRATFISDIKTVTGVTRIPSLSTQQMNCGGKQYSGGFYVSANGSSATLNFYLRGSQTCPTVAGVVTSGPAPIDDTTVCNLILTSS